MTSPNPRTRFDFVYAPDDIAEALKAHRPELGRRPYHGLIGWIVFISVAIAIFSVFQARDRPATSDEPNDALPIATPGNLLPALLPWIILFLVTWVIVFKTLRGRAKKMWNTDAKLQCSQVMEVSDAGIGFENPFGKNFSSWIAFGRFIESEHLFILYNSSTAVTVVPKRLFDQPSEEAWFRDTLQREITQRHENAVRSGFSKSPAQ